MILLPLIAFDIISQDTLPIRLYPFIYLLYCILYYTSITHNINTKKIEGLSPREEEVVHYILKGKSNRQISEELFISIPTVKTHITNIFKKTGVNSRFELVGLS
ncbi:MAG: helix-turn-helix transcriptional regulator [Spirochaetaceae bacterium]